MLVPNNTLRVNIFHKLLIMELFERFGYYTVSGLLILFSVHALGWSDSASYQLVAAIGALFYIAPMIGGTITDRFLTTSHALILGSCLLLSGYILLGFSHQLGIHLGLATLIVGMSFFKFAPSVIIGSLYQKQKQQLDRLFIVFYMCINLGSLAAFMVSGWLQHAVGWYGVFAIPALGLFITSILAIKIYYQIKPVMLNEKKIHKNSLAFIILCCLLSILLLTWLLNHILWINVCVLLIAACLLTLIARKTRQLDSKERRHTLFIGLMSLIALVFFILYAQQPLLLTLFIDRLVDRQVGSVIIPSAFFEGFAPMWIIILGPLLAKLFKSWDQKPNALPLIIKYALGLMFVGIGYLVLAYATHFAGGKNSVPIAWLLLSFLLQSLGELLVSALGLSLMAQWAPKAIYSSCMGGWFLVQAIGSLLAGYIDTHNLSITAHSTIHHSIAIYAHGFFWLGISALLVGILVWLMGRTVMAWVQRAPIIDQRVVKES